MPRRKDRTASQSNSDSDDSGGASQEKSTSAPSATLKSFKEKREQKRRENQEKRRAKQVCRLCGQAGHVRRECPGIDDGGRGESKYKAKVAGASQGKASNRKERGQKEKASPRRQDPLTAPFIVFPTRDNGSSADEAEDCTYFDASCECLAVIEYLQQLRKPKPWSIE